MGATEPARERGGITLESVVLRPVGAGVSVVTVTGSMVVGTTESASGGGRVILVGTTLRSVRAAGV